MEMINIPKADYEALVSAKEELEDILAFDRAMAEGGDGLPHDLMLRLINGESALKVFREWRGFSQSALSRASRVHRVQIADIEAGRANGSVQTWKQLAEALDVGIEELV
ncbi:MAG: helix-turn-helix transcriptional regulator [Nitratireductor sp.]